MTFSVFDPTRPRRKLFLCICCSICRIFDGFLHLGALISLCCVVWVLHYIGWRIFHLSGFWGPVYCMLFTSVRLEVLALSNFPAQVHFVIRVSQDITASVVLCFLTFYVIDTFFSLIAPLVTGISNPMASLRRSSFMCTIDDANRESISHIWRTPEDSFVFEFVWLIRSLFWPMILNVLVAFHDGCGNRQTFGWTLVLHVQS